MTGLNLVSFLHGKIRIVFVVMRKYMHYYARTFVCVYYLSSRMHLLRDLWGILSF